MHSVTLLCIEIDVPKQELAVEFPDLAEMALTPLRSTHGGQSLLHCLWTVVENGVHPVTVPCIEIHVPKQGLVVVAPRAVSYYSASDHLVPRAVS